MEKMEERFLIVKLPKGTTGWAVEFSTPDGKKKKYPFAFKGRVALVEEACRVAGVVWKNPRKRDLYWHPQDGWVVSKHDINYVYPVIPAGPEPVPCQNCQDIRNKDVPMDVCGGPGALVCYVCGRPESEWTYAKDVQDDPERYEIGVGV